MSPMPIASTMSRGWRRPGRSLGRTPRPSGASRSSCRTIRRAADAPAMPSASTRRRAPPRSCSCCGAEGYDTGGRDWQAADIERLLLGDADHDRDSHAGLSRLAAACRRACSAQLAETWGEPAAMPSACPCSAAAMSWCCCSPIAARRAIARRAITTVNCPPSHAYVALYAWLRETEKIDALIHLGTHGTLEWLPGKALALSAECWPEAVLGALPVIYPFIVNNPGEAVQAKRRLAAVTIGHLTPPLSAAGLHGPLAELEGIIEEYAAADGLDRRRLRFLEDEIVERAWNSGLAADCGLVKGEPNRQAIAKLDAQLCDIKELSIRDGLHVFGRTPDEATMQAARRRRPEDEAAVRACGRSRARGAPRRPRRTPRGARSGRRAVARPRRRAADRPQPHLDRSARHPDPHRRRPSACAPPTKSCAATCRITASRRARWSSTSGPRPRCAPAATISPRRCGISACARPGTRPRAASPASKSCRWPRSTGRAST